MTTYGEQLNATTVRFERLLPGPIERVWAFLVEPDKRAQWFAGGPMELKPGGRMELQFDHRRITPTDDKPPAKYENYAGEMSYGGKVVEAAPPHLLVFDWMEESGVASRVKIELVASDKKVRLTLTHSQLASREEVVSVSGGWHVHLDILEAILTDGPRPRLWAAMTRLEAEYDARYGA